ncbi:hypothetical protein OHS33_39115 (plasmid) [Streptomyces sp. NBC_00536]|uniref:hypothetical protein n=1 Tax=Streptomyces sp. NBC_00536 TaxID=2975769 RepID=UPI002E82254D|nr:hypothetical protein [Streptomyces sp. NBC_00536]WUC84370.1 hypothetical protein OHS33_39115 [Streptomyces sp. NBC_00536]
METLLLGRWDHGGNLVIEESHLFEDAAADAAAMQALVDGQDDEDGMAWADAYPTTHLEAIQAAYEEYVHEEDNDGKTVGGALIDETTTPSRRIRKS